MTRGLHERSWEPGQGGTSTLIVMSVTVELPTDALARLEAEAARRGVGIDTVIAELAQQLPRPDGDASAGRLAISGIGASGGGRGRARDADDLLAEGFGRD